jgi:nicotinamide mononucleotide transporter
MDDASWLTGLEWAAAALGLVNVGLVVARSVWNYPFGLAMVACYAIIFFEDRLYSDALLQLFFVAIQLYGWMNWLRSRAASGEVVVLLLGWRARFAWTGGCAVAILVWGWVMHRYTDAAYPWWDGSVAMISVAAQILMSGRYLENWLLWIAVDLTAIPLYFVKDLRLTALLYGVFLVMSVAGLIHWAGKRRRPMAAA